MPAYTPAFNTAVKNFRKLSGKKLETLVAKHQNLSPEERSKDLKNTFASFAGLSPSSENAAKMTDFLKAVDNTVESKALIEGLQQIEKAQSLNEKFSLLTEVFKNTETQRAFEECWEMYLDSQPNVMRDIGRVIEENISGATQAAKNLNSQSDYDLTKSVVKRFMELFYMLFDIVLISAGHQNVVVSDNNASEMGAMVPGRPGLFNGPDGVRPARFE